MQLSTWWWILGGVIVALELLVGTLYLLMVALGMAAGAIAAHLGLGLPLQITTAAVVSALAVLISRRLSLRKGRNVPASADRDINLDIGATIHVDAWQPDGTARVHYRGSQWTVQLRAGSMPSAGLHRVGEVQGSHLIVDKA